MKFGITILLLLFSCLTVSAQEPKQEDLLVIFSAPEQSAMESLWSKANGLKNSDARWMCLAGFASATLADHEWSPYSKLKRFNTGKDLIEAAVSSAPNDSVIRLMRLMIQLECPFFLDYRSSIDSDLQVIARGLRGPEARITGVFRTKTLSYLSNNKTLTPAQKESLKNAAAI